VQVGMPRGVGSGYGHFEVFRVWVWGRLRSKVSKSPKRYSPLWWKARCGQR